MLTYTIDAEGVTIYLGDDAHLVEWASLTGRLRPSRLKGYAAARKPSALRDWAVAVLIARDQAIEAGLIPG